MTTLNRGMVGTSGTSKELVLGVAMGKRSNSMVNKIVIAINELITAIGSHCNSGRVGPQTTNAKSSRVVTTTEQRIEFQIRLILIESINQRLIVRFY